MTCAEKLTQTCTLSDKETLCLLLVPSGCPMFHCAQCEIQASMARHALGRLCSYVAAWALMHCCRNASLTVDTDAGHLVILSLNIHHFCLLLHWPESPHSQKTQSQKQQHPSQHVMHWNWW